MKKILWLVAALVIIIALIIALDKPKEENAANPIKIGVIMPLSGPIAMAGEYAKHGVDLAIKDLAAQEGGTNVEVIFEDGRYEPTTSVNAYNKLKNIDKVDAIIVFGTPTAMAIAPLVNKDKIPLLALLAAPAYSSPDDYTFRMMGQADAEAKSASEILFDKLGKKKIAVMYTSNDYGTGGLASMKKYAEGKGTIVAEEGSTAEATDYRSQLAKIKAVGAEAIFMPMLYTNAGIVLRQAKEMGYAPTFMCGQPCDTPDLLTVAGDTAEGMIVIVPTAKTESDFAARYKENYGKEPIYLSLKTYDALSILSSVAKECKEGDYEGECLKDKIAGLKDFPGLSYPINFDANGDVNDQFMLKVIKGGKYEIYE